MNEDETQTGSWDFDQDSELTGIWQNDNGKFEGTWESYLGAESIKTATSETTGLWYAPDESRGYWNTNSEGTGG